MKWNDLNRSPPPALREAWRLGTLLSGKHADAVGAALAKALKSEATPEAVADALAALPDERARKVVEAAEAAAIEIAPELKQFTPKPLPVHAGPRMRATGKEK